MPQLHSQVRLKKAISQLVEILFFPDDLSCTKLIKANWYSHHQPIILLKPEQAFIPLQMWHNFILFICVRLSACMSVYYMHAVPTEARRGHQNTGKFKYQKVESHHVVARN